MPNSVCPICGNTFHSAGPERSDLPGYACCSSACAARPIDPMFATGYKAVQEMVKPLRLTKLRQIAKRLKIQPKVKMPDGTRVAVPVPRLCHDIACFALASPNNFSQFRGAVLLSAPNSSEALDDVADDDDAVQSNLAVVDQMPAPPAINEARLRQIIREEIDARTNVTVSVTCGTRAAITLPGQHRAFKDVVELCAERVHVLLVGPTGCGKSFLAKSAAEALGLRFGKVSVSGGMSEGALTGRLLPVGEAGRFEYVISVFVDFYENGGVLLLDEIDASMPDVMLVINAGLDETGSLPVMNRPGKPAAERHRDFVCIGAANTFGVGFDRVYVGRSQLDDATLDRFRLGQIEMDYDPVIEAQVCPDRELREFLQGVRAKVRSRKMRRNVSTRFLAQSYRMFKCRGWNQARILKALTSGWSEDDVRYITSGMGVTL